MAGKLTFRVGIYQTNTAVLPELENKAKDLSPLFDDIIDTWADLNKQKFMAARGGEEAGAQVDPGGTVFWQPLSPRYLIEKLRHYPTHTLMVRTGALASAMTDPRGFFRMVTPEQAVFGTPNDAEDAMKVQYNWEKRQVIFLADYDQNMIREKTSKYFTAQITNARQEAKVMDAAFEATIGE